LNKLKAKTRIIKSSTIFFIIVFIAGTFNAISPLFIIEVQAQTSVPSSSCEATSDTITGVGAKPFGIAYDPVNKRMYVTVPNSNNSNADTVSVIDTTTNTVVGSPIPVGMAPLDIAYDPVNKRMYVVNFHNSSISVVDTTTNTVVGDQIEIGSTPRAIAYDPVNERMYVDGDPPFNISESRPVSIYVIDTTTNSVVGSPIPVGGDPQDIAYDPVNKKMYVTGSDPNGSRIKHDTNKVSIIDTTTNTVVGSPIPVGKFALDIAYDPVNKRMYVTAMNFNFMNPNGTVSAINTTTNSVVGSPILVGESAQNIAYDPVNKRMYVTNSGNSTVSAINTTTNSVVGSPIPVGRGPQDIAYDPVNKRMYVTNSGNSTVSVINLC
jgi:YVTN family beta-propeller protein